MDKKYIFKKCGPIDELNSMLFFFFVQSRTKLFFSKNRNTRRIEIMGKKYIFKKCGTIDGLNSILFFSCSKQNWNNFF